MLHPLARSFEAIMEYYVFQRFFKSCNLMKLYSMQGYMYKYRVFNLKVDHQLSREYFTSDAIYKQARTHQGL